MTAVRRQAPIASPSGLVAHVNADGSLRRLEHGDVVINLFPGSEIEGGTANVYLCRLGAAPASTPLLGPRSPLAFHVDERGIWAAGDWQGVRVALSFRLAASTPAWLWHVGLENVDDDEVRLDVVYAQDVALAHYDAIRMNEYYVSQYLDHTPLVHPKHGTAVAVRQNLPVSGRHPWAILGSLAQTSSFATDALQVHGLATRAGETPAALAGSGLPGARRQHEHAMVALQARVHLGAGDAVRRGFFGWFEPDHPAATSEADLAAVERAIALPEAAAPIASAPPTTRPTATLFSAAPILRCRDLADAEIARTWGGALRHVERADGRMLSFFTGAATHVAMRAKEVHVLRPHGHLLRTGDGLEPDESSLTTTVWMAGVFNSLLTQGHVGINRLLSTTRSYLSLYRAHGQRIFVELHGRWQLLDVPSAWEITATGARWLYAHDGGVLEVRVSAGGDRHAIDLTVAVLDGVPVRLLVANHVALGGDDGAEAIPARLERDGSAIVLRPAPDSDVGRRFPDGAFRIEPLAGTVVEQVGRDELLFADARSRDLPYAVIVTPAASAAGFRITGELVRAAPVPPLPIATATLEAGSSGPLARDVARLHEILPWYVHDALVHYLAPRGLEQFSGGGWGTRDVCQGPVELLLALDRVEPVRGLLERVFANQNPDGDWPQWFMFFARDRNIRPADSHGDIVFWPLLALSRYVLASADATILDAIVPFFDAAGDDRAERATVWRHVERALGVIEARLIPGTRLVAFGNGDWDDSLQPADPAMRDRLCSAWTVTLHHQTLATLARALRTVRRDADAARLESAADAVRGDFARVLLPDGVLPGFAYFRDDGHVDYLLHPRDRETGIRYRLLPMIHAVIADLLTPAQASAHVALIREHLLGVDGARLFDRPPPYRGGPQRHFQRAESSTFFGREIGLMYTHAHLRYAEAMARLGDADALFEALRRVSPIALDTVVPTAMPRQASCYYSSSDAVLADRYEAAARYDDVRAGRVPLEGGWRVYSSGAGIAVRLVHECFLGLCRGRTVLGIDPVVPKALDGLRAETTLDGRPVRVVYRIAALGHGPSAVVLNGAPLPVTRMTNPYRTAGVTVPMTIVRERLRDDSNELVIELG
jgi:cellobiose phosphorylase